MSLIMFRFFSLSSTVLTLFIISIFVLHSHATAGEDRVFPLGNINQDAPIKIALREAAVTNLSSLYNSTTPGFSSYNGRDFHGNLLAKRDFTCGPGSPCVNGACCGAEGFCGYGETYCGAGCQSNCDAHAECGQYSDPPGKTCPLNVCCSEFGFCGSTEDFCTGGCQSNCDLDPAPPQDGGGGGEIRSRVVGYYESWMARSTCHQMLPKDLPLNVLTHLNYAFGFIDPNTFDIVTMDSLTDEDLFRKVAEAKVYNNDLKVYLSIGGWTFSDDGTVTQPIFGNIARNAANRQSFADNCVKFMKQWGYDGIDIDWEYPGAPDRGGSPEDVANFVLLMETLKNTFRANGGFGLTYTAPASFWYLRWFDLPGLNKHVDWINLMSYDLHGEWDQNNQIGNIIGAHTNLTEMKEAVKLFWRNGVPPSKLHLGVGFYGRSFHLQESSCNTPGCRFQGSADPGPCSKTGGILMYYEVMALLEQNPDLEPFWDKEAAVKYLTYGDGSQWISYDDADTFKQKVEWANKLGMSGSLIWASDADDDKYSAHAGFLGNFKEIEPKAPNAQFAKSFTPNINNVISDLQGQNGAKCIIYHEYCGDEEDPAKMQCPFGMKAIGSIHEDKTHCGSKMASPICCPPDAMPSSCVWRGGSGTAYHCNGLCHTGEVPLFSSQRGGFPTTEDLKKCTKGSKAFCCKAGEFNDVTQGCFWTKCGAPACGPGTKSLIKKNVGCGLIQGGTINYCCPTGNVLSDCKWRGDPPDCADALCAKGEITIDQDWAGDHDSTCLWGREKSACCKLKAAPAPKTKICRDPCLLAPELCEPGEDSMLKRRGYVDYTPWDRHLPKSYATSDRLEKRRTVRIKHIDEDDDDEDSEDDDNNPNIRHPLAYPGPPSFNAGGRSAHVLQEYARREQNEDCTNSRVIYMPFVNNGNNRAPVPSGFPVDTEHPIDLQVHMDMIEWAERGRLPTGADPGMDAISPDWFRNVYFNPNGLGPSNRDVIPSLAGGAARGLSWRSPERAVWEAFGTNAWADNLLLCERSMNTIKGQYLNGAEFIGRQRMDRAIVEVRLGNREGAEEIFTYFNLGLATMEYTQTDNFRQRFINVASDWADRSFRIWDVMRTSEAEILYRFVRRFIPDNYVYHGRRLRQSANRILDRLEQAIDAGFPGDFNIDRLELLYTLQRLRDQIPEIYFVDYDT